MSIERHVITTREDWLKLRARDVTASVAGCLLGVHDYTTAYELWALKTRRLDEAAAETDAMRRGRLLEPVALQILKEEHPKWDVRANKFYYRDPAERLGATPDIIASNEHGLGIVQVKSVEASTFRKKWKSPDGEIQLPIWIAVQAIVEAHLTGAKWACVAALVASYGIEFELIDVPIHAGVVERVLGAVRDFWRLVDSGGFPDPDYGRDCGLIERFMAPGDGPAADLSGDNEVPLLVEEIDQLKEQERAAKAASDRRREIKAQLLVKLGGAPVGRLADGRLITSKTINRPAYQAKASSYVDLRVKEIRA